MSDIEDKAKEALKDIKLPVSDEYLKSLGNKAQNASGWDDDNMDALFPDFDIDWGEIEKEVEQMEKSFCSHNWEEYYGLIECYEYCTKCDKKRNIKNG